MHNETTIISSTILDRAVKARNRRDRNGKKRRPVTDGLIEHCEALNERAIAAESAVSSLRLDDEVLRDVVKKQSEAMDSMDAEIFDLKQMLKQKIDEVNRLVLA